MDQASRSTGIQMQGYHPSILATGILGPQSAEVLSGIIYPISGDQHPASSSPLFVLHELMTRAGIETQPDFDFAEVVTNQGHMYRCTARILFRNEVIQGSDTALTKKDAKNKAAYQVIQVLKSRKIGAMNANRRHYPPRKERKPDVETTQSPISMLTEYCNRSMLMPTFTFSESGPVHMRKFECEVVVRDPMAAQDASLSGKGEGKTKKDAKHDAARNLLKSICPEICGKLDLWFERTEATSKTEKTEFEQVPGNPLAELNDMCMKTKKCIPEYIEEEPEGSPHDRVFTTTCKLGTSLIEKGQGSSKKNAKRAAAYKMLQRIKETPELSKELDDTVEAQLQNLSLSSKTPKVTPTELVRNFSKRQGNVWETVRNANRASTLNEPLKLLHEVAEEQKLKVGWIDLQDPMNGEKFQLLILSCESDLCLTFLGKGENRNSCRKNAADNALLFMRSSPVGPA